MGEERAKTEILRLLLNGQILDCGELSISKSSLGRKKVGERFLVYLPIHRNYLWKLLHERKTKLRVYLEMPKEL